MTACSHGGSSVPLLPRGVRRVLDATRANVGHDWSLADLADISGVSGRTLQRHCRLFRFGCFESNSELDKEF
jgi:transcriptional regulator GlxA family with amidase domain